MKVSFRIPGQNIFHFGRYDATQLPPKQSENHQFTLAFDCCRGQMLYVWSWPTKMGFSLSPKGKQL